MRAFIGTKIIKAEEAQAPAGHVDADGHPDEGMWGYAVEYPDGYRSWSPKDTFETAYRLVSEGEKELCR